MIEIDPDQPYYRWHDGHIEEWMVFSLFTHPNGCRFVSFGRLAVDGKPETLNNIPVSDVEKEKFISVDELKCVVEDYCRAKFDN